MSSPEAMADSPAMQVATGPYFLIDGPVIVVLTARLMQANDVKASPIELASRPRVFLSNAGKKAKKVESPTLKRNETTQTEATPVHIF